MNCPQFTAIVQIWDLYWVSGFFHTLDLCNTLGASVVHYIARFVIMQSFGSGFEWHLFVHHDPPFRTTWLGFISGSPPTHSLHSTLCNLDMLNNNNKLLGSVLCIYFVSNHSFIFIDFHFRYSLPGSGLCILSILSIPRLEYKRVCAT